MNDPIINDSAEPSETSFLNRDPFHTTKVKLEQKAQHRRIREEMKPMFAELMTIFSQELHKNYPYLTSVLHQLALLQENDEKAKETLARVQADKGAYSVKIHPIETRHITEYNKKLVAENEALASKNRELFDQLGTMRKNYNRDLTNR